MRHRIDLEMVRPPPARPTNNSEIRWRATYEGREIGTWRVPECAAARRLIAEGFAERNDMLETYRDGRPCLIAWVGWLADRTVPRDVLRFVKWNPRPEGSFSPQGSTQNRGSDEEEAE